MSSLKGISPSISQNMPKALKKPVGPMGTYRLSDALQRGHPLSTVHHELQRHGQCMELPLPGLSEAAVAAYLTTRFAAADLPAGLGPLVHQRTEGQPLFMVTVVDDWVRRGWLVQTDAGWILQVGDFVEVRQIKGTVVIKPKKLVDAEDVLTPEEEVIVRKGEAQLRRGEYVTLEDLEHDLDRPAVMRRRKTT